MDNPILDEMPEAYISQSEAQGEQPELTLVECSDCGATTDNVDVDGTYICSCGHKGKWKPSYPAQELKLPGDVLVEKLLGVNWNNIAFTLDKAHPKGLDALMALATALHENAALKVKLNNSADVSNSMQNNLHALLAAKDARIAELQNRLDSLPDNEGWSKQ